MRCYSKRTYYAEIIFFISSEHVARVCSRMMCTRVGPGVRICFNRVKICYYYTYYIYIYFVVFVHTIRQQLPDFKYFIFSLYANMECVSASGTSMCYNLYAMSPFFSLHGLYAKLILNFFPGTRQISSSSRTHFMIIGIKKNPYNYVGI